MHVLALLFRGRLFCGTLSSGTVHALEVGRSVSRDNELKAGWRHLAAVCERGWLRLIVDGKPGAESAAGSSEPLALTNNEPLRIGFGTHDHFKGSLSGLRLYGRALKAGEITGLATKGRGVLEK